MLEENKEELVDANLGNEIEKLLSDYTVQELKTILWDW